MTYEECLANLDKTQYVEELFELFIDFDEFSRTYNNLEEDNFVSEKPDFISDSLWNNLFIKDFPTISMYVDYEIHYLEIERVNVGIIYIDSSVLIFCFTKSADFNPGFTVSNVKESLLNKAKPTISKKFKMLCKVAIDIYGEDAVMAVIGSIDPDIASLQPPSYITILINHKSFWVKDDFGIQYKIGNGFTSVSVRDSGSIYIKFLDISPDALTQNDRWNHPHTKAVPYSHMTLKSVCKGSGSPLNMALGVFADNPNEDNAYNLFFNYNNLIEQESEEGGPYFRLRRVVLKRSSQNMSRMSFDELVTEVKHKNIDIAVSIDSLIQVHIDKDSLTRHLTTINNDQESTYYCNKDKTVYYKKLTSPIVTNFSKSGVIYFNGNKLDVKVQGHDPDRFNISGVGENSQWKQMSMLEPYSHDISELEDKLTYLFINSIIGNQQLKTFDYDENKKQLSGLITIGRNSDIEDILGIEQPDSIPA